MQQKISLAAAFKAGRKVCECREIQLLEETGLPATAELPVERQRVRPAMKLERMRLETEKRYTKVVFRSMCIVLRR